MTALFSQAVGEIDKAKALTAKYASQVKITAELGFGIVGDKLAAHKMPGIAPRPEGDGCAIRVERAIRTENGDYVVKGAVAFAGSTHEAVEGPVEILLADEREKGALVDPIVIVNDSTTNHPIYPGCFQRVVRFSARISDRVRRLTVWAIPENSQMAANCLVVTARDLLSHKRFWANLCTTADFDRRYDGWFRTRHAAGSADLAMQAAQHFADEPVFSIVVPLYNTPIDYFNDMVASVLRQSYERFQLVLVNASPSCLELAQAIDAHARQNDRITCVNLEHNLGIAENTNAGIRAATGDFVCFLDHDDLLTPDALYRYAKAVNDYPATDVLYSDEDNLVDGRFETPYFKPDWNPDLLLSRNYVCHFLCIRKSIIDEVELPTDAFDGAQDYHLTLQATERARNVHHVRRVLYHWRVHPESTANDMEAKPYAIEAGKRALESALARRHAVGTVRAMNDVPGGYEVEYELTKRPLVSIIIPNKDSINLLDRCLHSIVEKSTYDNFEVLVMENNSANEATFEYYDGISALDERMRIVRFNGKFNYSRINNEAAEAARGDYFVFLNNDTEVISPDWLERMLVLCMRENTGVVGVKLLYPDNTVQHAGLVMTRDFPFYANMHRDCASSGYYDSLKLRQDYSAVTAACMMTSRKTFETVGGMDEDFPVDYNDVDYCLAVRETGLLVAWEPRAVLYHYESATRGFHPTAQSQAQFQRALGRLKCKWPRYFADADPMGNPNFEQSDIYPAYHHLQL